ncbi:MAG: thymidine phosphorylase [Planctomycetota bacterium]
MNVAQLIAAKRDGRELTGGEIRWLVEEYAAERLPDYQMAAWAMAVYFRGMTEAEIVVLTQAMLESGQPLVGPPGRPKVDKHSTGGIGDKTSIPLAPILAVCGLDVPMISGRGLGATGGTLDKLEAIPGFRTNLSVTEIRRVIAQVGCVITGASGEIAPADKRLYSLRDVTATVPSIPLITASILSKKLSEGLDALVLDVKWGSGAFMKTLPEARRLAESLVRVANLLGVRTRALITNMNRPLGRMIGNGLEVDESLEILAGLGPEDSRELTIRLAAELLVLAGVDPHHVAARKRIIEVLESGAARARFVQMVEAQGGSLSRDYSRATPRELHALQSGYLTAIDGEELGFVVIELGGGRKALGDKIDPGVGVEMLCELGQKVRAGEPVARIYARTTDSAIDRRVLAALSWGEEPPVIEPLVAEVVESSTGGHNR